MLGTRHIRLCFGAMSEKRENPDLMAASAVIEHLREEAHLLRDLLSEAYFKIAILEKVSEDPSQPSEQPDKDYRWTH